MIFINTRPVDEGAMNLNRRKSSSVQQKPSTCDAPKLSMLVTLLYLLISCVCIILYYPLSLVSLILPVLLLFYTLLALRRHSQFDVWAACFLAILGILIKGAGLITFLSLFDVSPMEERKATRGASASLNPRAIFFIVLIAAEVVAVIAAGCLKWHLIAFHSDTDIRHVRRQSKRVSTNA